MVDSNDRERVTEAKEELARMLAEDELRDAVLLVFANKQVIYFNINIVVDVMCTRQFEDNQFCLLMARSTNTMFQYRSQSACSVL